MPNHTLDEALRKRLIDLNLDPNQEDPFANPISVGGNINVANQDDVDRVGRRGPNTLKLGDVLEGPAQINFREGDPLAQLQALDDPGAGRLVSAGNKDLLQDFIDARDLFDAFKGGKEIDQDLALRTLGPDVAFQELQGIKGLFSLDTNNPRDSFFDLLKQNPDMSGKELKEALERVESLKGNLQEFARKAELSGNPSERDRSARARDNIKALLDRLGFSEDAHTAIETGSGRIASDEVDALNKTEDGVDLKRGTEAFVKDTQVPTSRSIRDGALGGDSEPETLPDPQRAPQKSGTKAGVRGAASGDPVAEEITAGYEEYTNLLDAHKDARDLLVESAEERDRDFDQYLDKWEGRYKEAYEKTQATLDKNRERVEQNIAKKQKNDEMRLQWQKNEELRDLKRQEMDAVEKEIMDLSLTGGFASGQGAKAIREAENEYRLAAIDLKIQFGHKETEISTRYTDKYIEIENQYKLDTEANLEKYRSELQRIEEQEGASELAKDKAIAEADAQLIKDQEKTRMELAKAKRADSKSMREDIASNKKELNDQKEQARKELQDAFLKFKPGSPQRQVALDRANRLGVNTGNISIHDDAVTASAKTSQELSAELHDVTPYLDDPEKLNLINMASAVADLAVKSQVDNQYKKFKQLIDAGEHDEAIKFMKNFAQSNMSAGMKESNAARNTVIIKSGELLSALDKIEDTGAAEEFFEAFGKVGEKMNKRADKAGGYGELEASDFNWYTRELQNLRNKFGMDKTPELQELYAKVQNIASSIIKERYGSAVTEPEMALARAFIAMPGDTLNDMKIKIKEFAEFSAEENRQELGTVGIPADLFMPGLSTDLPIEIRPEVVPTDDDINQMIQEMEEDIKTMGEVSYSGRNYVAKEFDGRKVELAKPVMVSFNNANEDFKRDHGVDIRVASVATASKRDQAKTIQMMARESGIEFNESDPNETAEKLREMGRQVANVGASKHEIGEAVDLYPFEITIGGRRYTGSEYIALVKPYLERYGIMQANHMGRDPGNFEFSQIS